MKKINLPPLTPEQFKLIVGSLIKVGELTPLLIVWMQSQNKELESLNSVLLETLELGTDPELHGLLMVMNEVLHAHDLCKSPDCKHKETKIKSKINKNTTIN